MRAITSSMSQWRAQRCDGESLAFANCKGGYFSTLPDYGLRVEGRTAQDGVPTPDNPVPIRCVMAGTKVRCCGKNLFDIGTIGDWEMHYSDLNLSIGEDYAEGLVLNYAMGSAMSTKKIGLRCGDICTASWQTTGEAGVLIRLYDKDGNILTGAGMLDGRAYHYNTYYKSFCTASKSPETFIITEPSTAYVTIGIVLRANAGEDLLTRQRIRRIQIERGSVATAYEPYVGNEITVPCDLYEEDVWYPMTGMVERNTAYIRLPFADMNNSENFPGWRIGKNTALYALLANTIGTNIDVLIEGKGKSSIHRTYLFSLNSKYSEFMLYLSKSAMRMTYRQSELKEMLNDQCFEAVYRRETPIIEHYPPQPIWAPAGTVNILQTPVDAAAKLETTLMIRR